MSRMKTTMLDALIKPRRLPETPADLQVLNDAERHEMRHLEQKLVAWRWGVGPAVLLLHGWESRAAHMSGFVPPLLFAGYSVMALDAPAHGDSAGDILDVVAYGQAVAAVAAHLGPFKAVIAHSLGSAAALYAYAHGLQVEASVHICGPSSLTRALRRGGAALGLDQAEMARLELAMADHLGTPLNVMDAESLRAGMIHPVLLVHDPEDREVPVEESRQLATSWSGSTLALMPGIGHRRALKNPQVISAAVDFINQAAPVRDAARITSPQQLA